MVINRKAKIIGISGWVVTVIAAFSAGQWLSESPTPDSLQGKASENAVQPGGKSAGAYGFLDSLPAVQTEMIESSTYVDPESYSALARISEGGSTEFLWKRAEVEAELLSPSEAGYWAEAYMEMPPGESRNEVLKNLLGSLAKSDPLRALSLADEIGSLSASESARLNILEVWAQQDPQAALTWLENNRGTAPARMHRSRVESWMEGFAAVDAVGAFSFAASMPGGTNQEGWLKRRAMESVIEAHFAAGKWEDALTSLQSLPEGVIKSEAMQDFYSEWAKQDPASAADHFLLNRGEGGERAVAGLIREWASADPKSAAQFVANLENTDPAYQVAVSSLIERWSRYDLEGPAEWLNQLPPSDEIDRAVAVFSVRAAEEDPESAMTWAASISGEQARSRVMQSVAASWKESDPGGLEQYIQDNELDETTATQLREAERNRGWRRWN